MKMGGQLRSVSAKLERFRRYCERPMVTSLLLRVVFIGVRVHMHGYNGEHGFRYWIGFYVSPLLVLLFWYLFFFFVFYHFIYGNGFSVG